MDASSGHRTDAKVNEEVYDAFLLNFINPEVEQAFRSYHFEQSIRQVRLGVILGLVLYVIFGMLDSHLIPEVKTTAWIIRYVLVCPVLAAGIVLSYSHLFRSIMEPALVFMGVVAGVGIIAMVALSKPPGSHLYYAGLLLCSTFYFTFMRLRFVTATLLSWTVFILYEITAIQLTSTPAIILMNNTFFLVAFNLTGMSACYAMENYWRSDFLQRRTIQRQTDQLSSALQEVEIKRQLAEDISRHDPLTELFNRSYFHSIAEFERSKSLRLGHRLSIIMLDVDRFKLINDSYGHVVGDQVLQCIGRQIFQEVRTYDLACRYGGEEFAVLLPETSIIDALGVAERLRKSIENLYIATDKGPASATVSVGVAGNTENGEETIDLIIEKAERALRFAKNSGRNHVKFWIAELDASGTSSLSSDND